MATRKKRKGKATRRRRRIGGMKLSASNPLVKFGSMGAGFLLGDKINPAIDKMTGTMDPKIVGAGEAGIGAALVFMKLGKKPASVIQVIAGGVLLGAGAKRLLKAFGIMNGIGGYGSVPVIGQRRLNGYGAVPVIGGYTPNMNLAGVLNGGYTVPSSSLNVMGSPSGSGYSNSGNYME